MLFLLLAVESCFIAFAVVIIRSGLKKTLHRIFIVFLSAFAVWVFVNYMSNLQHLSGGVLLAINHILFVVSVAVPYSMYMFTTSVVGGSVKSIRLVQIVSAATAFLAMTPYVVNQIDVRDSAVAIVFGPMANLYFAGMIFLSLAALVKLVLGTRRRYGAKKRSQARVLLLSVGAAITALCVTNMLLPFVFNNYDYTGIGVLAGAVIIAGTAYAMIHHGLFKVQVVALRGVTYLLVLSTLMAIYLTIIFSFSFLFNFMVTPTEQMLPTIIASLLIALTFQPLKQFFDRITNKIFYRNEYDADVFYAELNRILTTTNDLKTLLTEVSSKISESLRAEHVSVYVTADGQKVRCAGTAKFVKLPPQDVDTLNEHVRAHGDAIMQIENLYDDERSLRRLMRSNKLAIIAPLVQYDVIVGYLCLGDHKSSHYSERDIKAIDTVADSIVIAVQNALSIQQVKDLNANLQQRIDDATSELRKSNAQLQRLDEAKDEFISMASHQLRTPLTSVKGYIDMVLEGDAGEIDDMQRHLLSEAFSSSERMVHLINDFLNVSRLQTGKFIIEKVPTDMANLVRQEVDSLEVNAKQRQMTFDLKLGKSIPKIMVDESKIRQVIMNFLDNSLYYSHADTAIVVRLKAKGGQLELTVKDTGIGVPEKEQAQLFTKFYRASNARRQRPDGTGVGLFLAKKVITAHGGHMLFHSEEGKGSTFGFVLPIDKLQVKD